MDKTFTKSVYIVSVIILFLTAALPGLARADEKLAAGANLAIGKDNRPGAYTAPVNVPTIDLLDFMRPETTSSNIIKATRFYFQGSGRTGSTITLYIDDNALPNTYLLNNSKIIWAFEIGGPSELLLSNGSHTVQAKSTDSNGIETLSTKYNFVINTTVIPNLTAPVITSPTRDAPTTSTPTFTGTGPSNSRIDFYIDNALAGAFTLNSSTTNWTFQSPSSLINGYHTIEARAVDANNNVSDVSTNVRFIVNVVPVLSVNNMPTTGVSTLFGTASPAKSFNVKGTDLTSDILVTAPANFEISQTSTGGFNSTTDIPLNTAIGGGNVAVWFRLKANAPVGDYSSSAVSLSSSGGAASISVFLPSSTVTDATPPTLTTVTILSNNVNSNTLATTGNTITLNFTSSKAINSPTVKIDNHTASLSNLSGNNWQATYLMASTDAEGTVQFNIAFTDLATTVAGIAVTATTDNSSVTFDRTAPTVPAIVIPENAQIVRDTHFTVTGTADVGSVVNIYLDGTLKGTSVSNALSNGINWSYTLTGLSTNASQNVTAKATDAAGNVSAPSPAINFSVDLNPVIYFTNAISGMSAPQGSASASQSFYVDGVNLSAGILVAAPANFEVSSDNTNFSDQLTVPLSLNGQIPHTDLYIRLKATAPINNYVNNYVTLTTPGLAPVNLPIYLSQVIGPPTLTYVNIISDNANNSLAKAGNKVTLSFSANQQLNNATVIIAGHNITPASGRGNFQASYTLASSDQEGIIPFSIAYTNEYNNPGVTITATTNNTSVTFDNTAPAAPVIVNLADFQTSRSSSFSVNGTAEVGSTVNIYLNDVLVAPVGTRGLSNGYNWSYTLTGLAAGSYHITTTARDPAGNVSSFSPAVNFTVDLTPYLSNNTAFQQLTTVYGTASASTFTNINGNNLTDGILVTPPAGVEVSTDNVTFGNTATIPLSAAVNGVVTKPVYIRLSATAPVGNYSDFVVFSTNGAADFKVRVSTTNPLSNVTAAPLTIKANDVNKNYGDVLSSITGSTAYTITSGTLKNGNTLSSVSMAYGNGSAANAPVSGTYTDQVIPSAAVGANGFLTSNYNITYDYGDITINRAQLTVTAIGINKPYDGTTVATVTFSDNRVSGDTFTTNYTAAFNNKNVGTGKTINASAIAITGGASANYTLTNTTAVTSADITAKGINVTAQADTKVYDGTNTSAAVPVVDALQSGDAVTTAPGQTFDNKNVATGKTLTAAGLVINDGNSGANYTVTYVPNATGAITAKGINVTAQADTKVYDGTNTSAAVPVVGALQSGDAVTTAPGQTFDNKNVATGKTLTAAGLVINDGNSGANYTVTYVPNTTGAITAKGINVTAQADTKVYDGTNTSAAVPVVGALQSGDAVTTAPGQTFDNKNVANGKTLTAAGLVISDGNSGANYTVTYVPNTTGAITAKGIEVTADAKSKVYGDADPSLTYKVTSGNLVNGDTFTGTLNRDAGEEVNTYAIKQGTLSPGNNYALSYNAAVLTITKAQLTITADNTSKVYLENNPPLTVSYNGFKFNDTNASLTTQPVISTTATQTSIAGTYALVPAGAASNNYNFAYVNGTLTIKSNNRTIAFGSLPVKTYGDGDFAPGGTLTSGETVVYTSSNTSVATIINGTIHIVGAGNTQITASAPDNSSYTATAQVSQLLIVDKATQTITFAPIPNQLRDAKYDLSAVTSSAGLPVTFTTTDAMIALIQNNVITAKALGTVNITASANGDANHYAAQSIIQPLKIVDANGNELIVRQAVSPNGDGINDFFYIEGINEHPDNRVTVISRNGVKIFEIAHYDNANNVFDGHSNVNGAMQQPGTYFYLIEYTENGHGIRKTGYFVIK